MSDINSSKPNFRPQVNQPQAQVSQPQPRPQPANAVSLKPAAPRRNLRPYILSAILVLLLVALGIWGLIQYKASKNAQAQLKAMQENKGTLGGSDVQQLIDQVGKLIVLPSDEQPTVATVTDLAKLQGQAFFANAQVGDKVLIYANAKKAILYRPSVNKIVELAPLNLGASPPAATTTPAATK